MAIAGPKEAIAGVTLISGTVTFLMFIYEEAVQTIMMALYVAHKNRLVKDARRLINTAADKYTLRAIHFTRDWGYLAPYALDAFKTYWHACLDMLETYSHQYDVDLVARLKFNRALIDLPLWDNSLITGLTPEEVRENAYKKLFPFNPLATPPDPVEPGPTPEEEKEAEDLGITVGHLRAKKDWEDRISIWS